VEKKVKNKIGVGCDKNELPIDFVFVEYSFEQYLLPNV